MHIRAKSSAALILNLKAFNHRCVNSVPISFKLSGPSRDGGVCVKAFTNNHADCIAMLIPSAIVGCASPAALPIKKKPFL
jgi:hypothetical protein